MSLFCAESIGEPEKVGERTVGDFGVAVPRDKEHQYYLSNIKKTASINSEQIEAYVKVNLIRARSKNYSC